MAETDIPTADVIAVAPTTEGPQVLLVLRGWDPYEGYWALPGGHVDDGETAIVAAARELEEETGVEVTYPARTLTWVGRYDTPGRDPRGPYVSYAYRVELDHAPTPTAADDAAEAVWFPLNRVLRDDFPLAFDHSQILADAAAHLTEQEHDMLTIYTDDEGNTVEEVRDGRDNVTSRTVTSPDGSVKNEVTGNARVGVQSAVNVNNAVIVNGKRVR